MIECAIPLGAWNLGSDGRGGGRPNQEGGESVRGSASIERTDPRTVPGKNRRHGHRRVPHPTMKGDGQNVYDLLVCGDQVPSDVFVSAVNKLRRRLLSTCARNLVWYWRYWRPGVSVSNCIGFPRCCEGKISSDSQIFSCTEGVVAANRSDSRPSP